MYRKRHHLLVRLDVDFRNSVRHPLPHGLIVLIRESLPDEEQTTSE